MLLSVLVLPPPACYTSVEGSDFLNNLKYHVFRYIHDHGDRAPRTQVEKKYGLQKDYFDILSGTLNDGDELRLDSGDVVLTPNGIEYVDLLNREKWFPAMIGVFGSVLGSVVGAVVGYLLSRL